jgi:pimeloyl-ACP methyl ester carboxylesterase
MMAATNALVAWVSTATYGWSMATLTVDGAELMYTLSGTPSGVGSRTLAFAHGWCSHSGHWSDLADRFASDHQVLRWDRRGMGQSPTTEPALAPARHADDLAAILDAEGIERVVMIAHAGGGPTGLSFATRHPDRTEALALVDILLHNPADEANATRIAGLATALVGEDGDAVLTAAYRSFFGPATSPDIVDAACQTALATDRTVAVTELEHVVTDTEGTARTVACPVLWISARDDDSERLTDVFDDVMIGRVVGSGHFPQIEVPAQVEAVLRTFLAQRTAA